jgi:hypothetical protein
MARDNVQRCSVNVSVGNDTDSTAGRSGIRTSHEDRDEHEA